LSRGLHNQEPGGLHIFHEKIARPVVVVLNVLKIVKNNMFKNHFKFSSKYTSLTFVYRKRKLKTIHPLLH